MVIVSPTVDDAHPVAAANGAHAPPPTPAANNFDPAAAAAALSLFDVVNGTTATADVGADTAPWWGWSSPPPYHAGSDAYASSSSPVSPPSLQSNGTDLACYAGSIMDTSSFLQLPAPAPAPVYMQPELSYFYYPQELQGFPSCLAAPLSATQPASMAPSSSYYYQQTQATTTGSASVEEASPALAATQQQAQEGDPRPAPRRRGRPPKRALAVSEPPPVSEKPTKRVAVGSNRAAPSLSASQRTSSAATGPVTMSSSAAGQQVPLPDQAGAASSSTGSNSGQQAAACTSANHTMACQLQRPDLSNGAPGAAGVVVEGEGHQQAAIAPPELVATGPKYAADTSAVGVRFQPTDPELIDYLRMKHDGQQMPVNFFKEFDVYQAHPTAIKDACGESQDGCWYAFSRRKRKYGNGKRPARSVSVVEEGEQKQVGFWKSNSKLGNVRAGGKKDGAVIGKMTSLTFQLGRQPKGKQTGWKMREYTIPENLHQPDGSAMLLNDWVVCQLFYKERPGCTNSESETDENATSVAVGQERHGKSETDVGQKRPRRSRKSKKDKPVHVPVGQEDGPGDAADESMKGEEGLQPEMVPADHLSSDSSSKTCV